MWRSLFFLVLLGSTAQVRAERAPLAVQVTRENEVFEVVANGEVRATPLQVWRVLTDYERMPEYVPDMQRNQVLERKGNSVTIEQFGKAKWLFFSRDLHLVVRAVETPMASIAIELVSGDMQTYSCLWEFDLGADGGTRIRYTGHLRPKFSIPSLLGASIVKSDIEHMMRAVLQRLDAEAAQAR